MWKVENFLWISGVSNFDAHTPVEIRLSFHIRRGKDYLVRTGNSWLFPNPHPLLMLTTVIYSLFLSKREKRKEICDEVPV